MQPRWGICSYQTKDGNYPVEDYIAEGNDEKKYSILFLVIRSLAINGLDIIDTNMCKALTEDLWELRKDRHRIIFCRDGDLFVLLSGFLKRTKKTPKSELVLADERMKHYFESKEKQQKVLRINLN